MRIIVETRQGKFIPLNDVKNVSFHNKIYTVTSTKDKILYTEHIKNVKEIHLGGRYVG